MSVLADFRVGQQVGAWSTYLFAFSPRGQGIGWGVVQKIGLEYLHVRFFRVAHDGAVRARVEHIHPTAVLNRRG